jgi:alpha-beta hydrolase superfamily lysophospholipase
MPFFDGARGRVHYRTWTVDRPRAVLVFLHGRGQRSADYHRFARVLRAREIEMWAIDHAGHGLSEGEPGVRVGLPDLAADAVRLIALARTARPATPTVLMGHSLGAATAVEAMAPPSWAASGVAAVVLCGTPRQVAAAAGGQPGVPTLVVHGVDDRLAAIGPVRAWAAAAPGVQLREFPDAGHDLLHEPVRDTVAAAVADFMLSVATAMEQTTIDNRPQRTAVRPGN